MSKWIPVLVRLEDLDLVTSYIGELEASRDDSHLDPMIELTHSGSDPAQVSLSEPTELDSRPSWDLEDLQRLAKGETATTSRWARASRRLRLIARDLPADLRGRQTIRYEHP